MLLYSFLSVGLSPETVPFLLPCTSLWGVRPVRVYGSTPMYWCRIGLPVPQVPPFQVPCSGMLSSPFDLLPCRKGNLKILLSKARKARMSDKDTSCYIYTCRMGIHTTLTRCIGTHFFLFFLPFSQRNTENCQGDGLEKPHEPASAGFFRIRTCEALDGYGVWSYICRQKREKLLIQ